MDPKRLELLRELVPAAHRVALLRDPHMGPTEHVAALKAAAQDLGMAVAVVEAGRPEEIAGALHQARAAGAEAVAVLELIGKPSRALATLAWSQLKQKYPAILADREPLLVETKLSGGLCWYRVRIGADGLEKAKALCAQLETRGASCLVQRN